MVGVNYLKILILNKLNITIDFSYNDFFIANRVFV